MNDFSMEQFDGLFEAVLKLKDVDECRKFFEDVCTIKEIQDLAQRYAVARMLAEGKFYTEIARTTGASTATISRVNKAMNYGEGGYPLVLSRTKEK